MCYTTGSVQDGREAKRSFAQSSLPSFLSRKRGEEVEKMTEAELIARAKAGDQGAFEQLVLDNQNRV